jgi:acyl-coenzyme A thioesterase PaaI-like protein
MEGGTHCNDVDGRIGLIALCGMIDTGLATVCRHRSGMMGRQATVQMHLQFTGAPAEGPVALEAVFDGFSMGSILRQSLCHGVVTSGDVPVCHARAAFVALPPPSGASFGAFPSEDARTLQPLAEGDLDAAERAVVDACDRALASDDGGHAFIDRFLGMTPEPYADVAGSGCSVATGSILSNRVGDVQGGLLLGLAATTARAAAPDHPHLSTLAASFMRPGRGEALRAHAEVLHRGRSLASVRTQIRLSEGTLVLDAVSTHAA